MCSCPLTRAVFLVQDFSLSCYDPVTANHACLFINMASLFKWRPWPTVWPTFFSSLFSTTAQEIRNVRKTDHDGLPHNKDGTLMEPVINDALDLISTSTELTTWLLDFNFLGGRVSQRIFRFLLTPARMRPQVSELTASWQTILWFRSKFLA